MTESLAAEIFGPEGELNAQVYLDRGVYVVEREAPNGSMDDSYASLDDLEESLAAGYRLCRR